MTAPTTSPERLIYLGTDMHVDVRLADGELVTARVQNSEAARIPAKGETVGLGLQRPV